MKKSKTKRYRS